MRYRVISDDDGHKYIIPVEKQRDFYEWVEDEMAAYTPEWCKYIDGGLVTFDEYELN